MRSLSLLLCGILLQIPVVSIVSGQENIAVKQAQPKIIYKYKKYERFDFEDFSIEGDLGGPGDLSISPRESKDFDNRLPLRRNFNPELRRAVNALK